MGVKSEESCEERAQEKDESCLELDPNVSSSSSVSGLPRAPNEVSSAPQNTPPICTMIENSDTDEVEANPEQQLNLSELEVSVLRELKTSDIIKVIDKLKSGNPLMHTLQTVVPEVTQRVELVLKGSEDLVVGAGIPAHVPGNVDAAALNSVIAEVVSSGKSGAYVEDLIRMCRVTPLRLTYDERVFLRLLESTLEVSEYTDKVDVLGRFSAAKRMANEIKQICAVLSGLTVAYRYEAGQRLIRERDFKANEEFFRSVFEIGRRYKILNPERMRENYGKLIYFLMDSRTPSVMEQLEFDCVAPVKTVWSVLKRKKNGMKLLRDPLLRLATAEIIADGKSRSQVQWEIREKENAIKQLVRTYSTGTQNGNHGLLSIFTNSLFRGNQHQQQQQCQGGDSGLLSSSVLTQNGRSYGGADAASYSNQDVHEDAQGEDFTPEEVEQCLYSLCDHNTFLRFNRGPCDKLIGYLKRYFHPHNPEPGFTLAIALGRGGARLSHSHARQYLYVLQSLTLWREMLHDILGLWCLAEKDLLSPENPYILRDTGQGLNRVQEAPHVYRSTYTILSRVQEKVGDWCGSSVIHLGDHNVPNAFLFIDKYVQIPRILGPLVICLDKIPALYASTPEMKAYIDTSFGGCDTLIKLILVDFFRHAFDGSGADNFYDAGSCIDGRLTSAWNWCSKIERKPYFPVFLLTGFSGFDGRF